jgi:hypothetical protein
MRKLIVAGLFGALGATLLVLSLAVALSAGARQDRPKCFGKVATVVDGNRTNLVNGTNGAT